MPGPPELILPFHPLSFLLKPTRKSFLRWDGDTSLVPWVAVSRAPSFRSVLLSCHWALASLQRDPLGLSWMPLKRLTGLKESQAIFLKRRSACHPAPPPPFQWLLCREYQLIKNVWLIHILRNCLTLNIFITQFLGGKQVKHLFEIWEERKNYLHM